jgi:hypothetical protein
MAEPRGGKRAKLHRQSLNSEVLHLLDSATGCASVDATAALAGIRRLHERAPLLPLTDELLECAIGEGRP